jgi:hypothetical protein
MYSNGGMSVGLWKSMLDLFPDDAKIVGFGNDTSSAVDYIFVESAQFDEVAPGGRVPDAAIYFSRKANGIASCDSIYWTDQSSVGTHTHIWTTYTGLQNTETYCMTCCVKK